MNRALALLMTVVALTASADLVRTDPTPDITVYTDADGAHIVTLVGRGNIMKVIDSNLNGAATIKNFANTVFGLGGKTYWLRTRFVGGRLICEKFGHRPDDPAKAEAIAKWLFAQSCS
jgi:hypothetical protein